MLTSSFGRVALISCNVIHILCNVHCHLYTVLTGFLQDFLSFSACECSVCARATGTNSEGLIDEKVENASGEFPSKRDNQPSFVHFSNGDEVMSFGMFLAAA